MKFLPEGVPLFVVIAGISGAVASAAFDFKDPKRAARKVVVGSVSAIYVSPLVAKWLTALGLNGDHTLGLAGWLCGLLGLLIVETIHQVAPEILSAWRSRKGRPE
ncbi:hypothetical protein PQU92_08310 [Asticcacaulis sp. BYS171W]|uniref:Holin n=1 Tax=Asticcacaulis aquaticus TaxID=2984212 RepID=A0ABT5HT92_9CAUL|nr:hypothetical protein [Asticcacaulis aquaticus]MDC7683277.1 hypothetical protein [Asticcacaulis aquaticus]